ncbi:MAG: hypothetical protein WCT99_02150 [Bacteroidota bacterium]|jgi:hypothetical protein
MGSQTILDLIASTMVFGSLLLMGIRINASSAENMQAFRGDLIVQQNLVEIVRLLEYDFRKIGYCKNPDKIPDPTKAIRYADSTRIKYLTDVDNDGNVDSIDYYIGPTSETSNTPNPRDRLIYRRVNNETPKGVNLGITVFNLQYFDANKDPITYPISNYGQISSMQITIQVENLAAASLQYNSAQYDQQYQTAYWRQVRLVARNLRNR